MSVFATYGVLAGSGKLDADVAAFLTATGITDATIRNALNTFVKGLKLNGLWTKAKAIYPFVGGTAFTHKWNLKDPRDLDAAFRLVFNGTVTHSSAGATGNGTNGYYNTFVNPSTNLAQNSASAFLYQGTNAAGVNGTLDFGCYNAGGTSRIYYIKRSAVNNTQGACNNAGNNLAFTGTTDARGFGGITRTSSASFLFVNESTTANAVVTSAAPPNFNIYGMCYNNAGTATGFTNRTHAFMWLGDGLTAIEAGTLRSLVNTLQSNLGR